MIHKARIYRSGKRSFECRLENGTDVSAWAQATLLKEDHLVVGDWVLLENGENEAWWIINVEKRKTAIFRNSPREQKKKFIASNVDLMMIVVSGEKPDFKRGLLDRYLVRMSQWDIPAILIFNKMDLFNKETNLKFEEERLKGLGVECFEVSSVQPEYQPQFFSKGMTNLKKHLQGKTAILLGQSGVGKSKLISELSDQAVDLLSAELGKVGKGSHTTTWAEMIDCQNFMLVDSPGIRSMSLGDIYQDEVLGLFPDLDVNSQRCKYQNCQHLENSQHCYFKTLDPSQEQNKPTLSRLESYQRIHQEASTKAAWERED